MRTSTDEVTKQTGTFLKKFKIKFVLLLRMVFPVFTKVNFNMKLCWGLWKTSCADKGSLSDFEGKDSVFVFATFLYSAAIQDGKEQ